MHLCLIRFLFCGILCILYTTSHAYAVLNQSSDDDVVVSLLTAASGDEVYSTFGHTAIRVHNTYTDIDEVYNYGMFDFSTPDFYPKFLRGQLPYFITRTSYRRFMYAYRYERRSVWEQKLDLTDAQKVKLFQFLERNLLPENKFYQYDFLLDNCTTRAQGAFLEVLDLPDAGDTLLPYRSYLKRHLHRMPWTEFGIDIVLGAPTDRIPKGKYKHFLPLMLMDAYTVATVDGRKVSESPVLRLDYETERIARNTPAPMYPLYAFMLYLLWELFLFVKKPMWNFLAIYDKVIYSMCLGVSILILFLWFATDHNATKNNWNLLWASPLFGFLLWSGTRYRYTLFIILGVCMILAAANAVYQFLPQFFHLAILPLSLALLLNILRNLQKDNL